MLHNPILSLFGIWCFELESLPLYAWFLTSCTLSDFCMLWIVVTNRGRVPHELSTANEIEAFEETEAVSKVRQDCSHVEAMQTVSSEAGGMIANVEAWLQRCRPGPGFV